MRDTIWLKRVLIPLWVIVMIWSVAVLVISVLEFSAITAYVGANDLSNYRPEVDLAAAIMIAFSSISIILVIAEIFLFARHTLGPVSYMVMSVITWILWAVILALDLVSAAAGNATGLAFLWSGVLFAACTAQLIYGAVMVHRKRTGKLADRGVYSRAEQGIVTQPMYQGNDISQSGPNTLYAPHAPASNAFGDSFPSTTHPANRESKHPEPPYQPPEEEEEENIYELQDAMQRFPHTDIS